MATHDAWLDRLEEIVRAYERETESAQQATKSAQDRLESAQRRLEVAKNFLDLERQRLARESPFGHMSVKEACILAIRDKGRATTKEIIGWLEQRGFKLETAFPGRAIHAALMHAPEVRKVAPGTYEATLI